MFWSYYLTVFFLTCGTLQFSIITNVTDTVPPSRQNKNEPVYGNGFGFEVLKSKITNQFEAHFSYELSFINLVVYKGFNDFNESMSNEISISIRKESAEQQTPF